MGVRMVKMLVLTIMFPRNSAIQTVERASTFVRNYIDFLSSWNNMAALKNLKQLKKCNYPFVKTRFDNINFHKIS